MSLVNSKKMFKKALKEGYAIPAFNVCNMESAQAVAEVAGEKNLPVIIAVSEGAGKYAGFDYIKAIVETASKHYSNEIVLCSFPQLLHFHFIAVLDLYKFLL